MTQKSDQPKKSPDKEREGDLSQSQPNGNQQQDLLDKLEQLKDKLTVAQEREKRSLADYQNLLRRTQQERSKMARFANKELIKALLPVVENLKKAADQIDDDGLQLVVNQLWSTLQNQGIERLNSLGQNFDIETMEAVDKQGEGQVVVAVVQPGYRLKGEVIQHAKVVLGSQDQVEE